METKERERESFQWKLSSTTKWSSRRTLVPLSGRTMDDDSCIYANIGGEMEYHSGQQLQQEQQREQRDEMVIHPYSLVRARSSHSVLAGT